MRLWFDAFMRKRKNPVAVKVKALDLAESFLRSCKSTEEDQTIHLYKSLEEIFEPFPMFHSELKSGSDEARDCNYALTRIFQLGLEECCPFMFEMVVNHVCREEKHFLDTEIKNKLYFSGLSHFTKEVQTALFMKLYHLVHAVNDVNNRVADVFMVPGLSSASQLAVQLFFDKMLDLILNDFLATTEKESETPRTVSFITRLTSCKLLGVMYAKLDRNQVHSLSSTIAMKGYNYLKEKDLLDKSTDERTKKITGRELSQVSSSTKTQFLSNLLFVFLLYISTIIFFRCKSAHT